MTSHQDPAFQDPAFDVLEPARLVSPLVFNSPHSGRAYPPAFLAASRLDARKLRRSEDSHVDALFACAADFGAPLLRAHFPRAWLDVNREPFELDPRMFEGRLPSFANTRSLRVAGGLGTIPRLVGDAQEIYACKLNVAEALERIERVYRPYHRALERLVARAEARFGLAILVDCHSMPSGRAGASEEARQRADFVLGDRYATSAAPAIVDCVDYELRRRGYAVHRNKPYAGGFITEHYGNPRAGRHALQIEVNRALYMNEETFERLPGFDAVADDLRGAVDALASLAHGAMAEGRLAAE